MIALARAVIRDDLTFPDFATTVVSLFWAALEPSLAMARRYIIDDLKPNIASMFDEFRASARTLAGADPAFMQFEMEAASRASDVQRALDDAATWFTRADVEAVRRYFTLEQAVKIAVESAMRCQRAFEADLNINTQGDVQISADSLVFVHDVLFSALDNVNAHSGLKNPKVDVRAHADVTAGQLHIEVLSDVKGQNRITKEQPLADIRKLIDQRAIGTRTRKEGLTGFMKLAAVVHQSERGAIDFGFTAEGRFFLHVTYSLIVQSRPEMVSE
jgi:hypothetical protein